MYRRNERLSGCLAPSCTSPTSKSLALRAIAVLLDETLREGLAGLGRPPGTTLDHRLQGPLQERRGTRVSSFFEWPCCQDLFLDRAIEQALFCVVALVCEHGLRQVFAEQCGGPGQSWSGHPSRRSRAEDRVRRQAGGLWSSDLLDSASKRSPQPFFGPNESTNRLSVCHIKWRVPLSLGQAHRASVATIPLLAIHFEAADPPSHFGGTYFGPTLCLSDQ
jgi:hypothetical protein